jgi:hypothetical protein
VRSKRRSRGERCIHASAEGREDDFENTRMIRELRMEKERASYLDCLVSDTRVRRPRSKPKSTPGRRTRFTVRRYKMLCICMLCFLAAAARSTTLCPRYAATHSAIPCFDFDVYTGCCETPSGHICYFSWRPEGPRMTGPFYTLSI